MLTVEVLQFTCVIMAAACLAVYINYRFQGQNGKVSLVPDRLGPANTPAFLFDGHQLIDATGAARDLIARGLPDVPEFDQLIHVLHGFFPTLAADIADLPEHGETRVQSPDDETLCVHVRRQLNIIRIALEGADHFQTLSQFQQLEQDALTKETENLRFVCENAPQLIWQEDHNGQVIWANKAYFRYSDLKTSKEALPIKTWPAHRLFTDILFPMPADATPLTKRRALQLHGEEVEHWFDVSSMPGPDGALHFATDANEVMRAQEAQKAFMGTVVNTFAQLSIGLAIFDRKRRLSSYNPAFGDLTGLPASFLIGRPSIEVVLDRLRDTQKLPEPKDYASFREQFAAAESKAKSGNYIENWEMPDGQTFRVTGRPHPDGALAFLFEDITAEISLTRRFRNEIEVGQAVLDNISDAVAVFSSSQNLVMSNEAYSQIWGEMDVAIYPNFDLRTALRRWKSGCTASGIWRDIERRFASSDAREPWSETIVLLDGRQLLCKMIPMSGGMTMIRFSKIDRRAPLINKLQTHDPALLVRKA